MAILFDICVALQISILKIFYGCLSKIPLISGAVKLLAPLVEVNRKSAWAESQTKHLITGWTLK
jgi:hypothetical protein